MTRTNHRSASGAAWLITPAVATDRFAKAQASKVQVALVDLEDSVAPSQKERARSEAAAFFTAAGDGSTGPLPGIRMNSLLTRAGLQDLVAMAHYPTRPPLVLVPMVESPRDIEVVAAALDADGYTPQIWALIETPTAIERIAAIVRAPRLAGVLFGSADYVLATGGSRGWQALLHVRSAVANSAAAVGIGAVDSPFFDLDDDEGLRTESLLAKALGFTGKTAVHPRQVPIINEAFAPTEEDLAQARAIVAAREANGASITAVRGQMVGQPFYAAALALIEQADHPA